MTATPFTYAELRQLSEDDLIRHHDAATEHVHVGLNYFIEELARRRTERQSDSLVRMTGTIERLTKWIAGLTGAAVLVTGVNLIILLADSKASGP